MKNIIGSLVAGAVGGALVVMLIANSPQAAKFFQSDKPLIPEAQVSSFGSTDVEQHEGITMQESMVVQAVEAANPAVVSIVVTRDVPIIERYYEEIPNSPFNPFEDFFGGSRSPFGFQVPQYRQKGTERREVGGGSGFLMSADGMIITNRHVVDQDDVEYTVFMNDGEKYDAVILARDPVNDLAVIKIEGNGLPFLEFGDSDGLKVGQTVIVIGNALAEFRNTVSVGVISGLLRSITAGNDLGQSEQLDEVIQTDAAINPGNSGGPLLNLNGQVVGVNVAMALDSENIGFALPSNLARDVVSSVSETGKIVRPYLGVRYMPVTPTLSEQNKLSVDYGVLVAKGSAPEELAVMPGSPADKAGLTEGDIILEVDGERLEEGRSLAVIIRKKKVGDVLELKVLSKGEERVFKVTLEELPQ